MRLRLIELLSRRWFSALLRAALVLLGLYNLVMGVVGVYQCRTWAAEAGVVITPAWYCFAVMGPVVAMLLACWLSEAALTWRNRALPTVLAIFAVISGGSGPLLYAIYGFEQLLEERQRHVESPL